MSVPLETIIYFGGAALSGSLALGFACVEIHQTAGFLGLRKGLPWVVSLGGFEALVSVAGYVGLASLGGKLGVPDGSPAFLVASVISPAAGALGSRIPFKRVESGRLKSLRNHALDQLRCRDANATTDWLEDGLPAFRATPLEEMTRRGTAFLNQRVAHGKATTKDVTVYRRTLRDTRASEGDRLMSAMEILLRHGGRDVVEGFIKRHEAGAQVGRRSRRLALRRREKKSA